MTIPTESDASPPVQSSGTRPSTLIKVGVIAAVSVLAGGLAAAWWHRKTLKSLRQTGETTVNPYFGIPKDGRSEEE
jgi:hypothetical protein